MNTTMGFQILDVLNPKSKSDLLFVKKTATDELFVWRTLSLRNIGKEKTEIVCNKIRKRIQQENPLLVKFYPIIEDEKLEILYISMEYFSLGNLEEFMKKSEKSNITHINEEVIVKVLFQLLLLLKSIDVCSYITSKNLYFDEYLNVKFLNFSTNCNSMKYDIRMCDIGSIIMQLCKSPTKKMCNKYKVNNEYYSTHFIELIDILLNDTNKVKTNIDKILCHPVILMNTFKLNSGMKLNGCLEILDYRTKLENLRKREVILRGKEIKLGNREHSLNLREKKMIICEKKVKNKLTQAELYLKRCKDSNKPSQIQKYENFDQSEEYEELECSDIVETSEKMNLDKLEKSEFIRTFSERRVRFKGHSPLKEMDFHKGKHVRKPKANSALFKDQLTEIEKSRHIKIECNTLKDVTNMEKSYLVKKKEDKKKRSIVSAKTHQLQDENERNMGCLPIAWTEESKKQAFDLLRIMNSTADRHLWKGDVKHTYL